MRISQKVCPLTSASDLPAICYNSGIAHYVYLLPDILFYFYTMVLIVNSCIADIISTVEFDHTGNYLATGDKGGRVVLFERNETVTNPDFPSDGQDRS